MQTMATHLLPSDTALQNGQYRIVEVLGQGGFGITYLAEHRVFGKVALKELFLSSGAVHCTRESTKQVTARFDNTHFDTFKNRFLEEARTLYKLRDIKGVVRVNDIFEENGTVYFSMEYIEGEKLDNYVKQKKHLTQAESLKIIESLAKTLSEVHKRQVLHCDVKPDNIIVSKTGEIVLIDFGIARSYANEVDETHTTFHSPRYSPPEQKIAKSRMGTFSDVYSLGATAYFVFTGKQPQNLEERITSEYIPPQYFEPNLSNEINEAINKSMVIREKERLQTMDDFLTALHAHVAIPSVSDDKTVIEPVKIIPKTGKPILVQADEKTQLLPTVQHDSTLIENTPSLKRPEIKEDEATLIFTEKENDTKEPFVFKTWIKTTTGRVVSGVVGLTALVGIILMVSTKSKPAVQPSLKEENTAAQTSTQPISAQNTADTLSKTPPQPIVETPKSATLTAAEKRQIDKIEKERLAEAKREKDRIDQKKREEERRKQERLNNIRNIENISKRLVGSWSNGTNKCLDITFMDDKGNGTFKIGQDKGVCHVSDISKDPFFLGLSFDNDVNNSKQSTLSVYNVMQKDIYLEVYNNFTVRQGKEKYFFKGLCK